MSVLSLESWVSRWVPGKGDRQLFRRRKSSQSPAGLPVCAGMTTTGVPISSSNFWYT